MVDQAVRDLVPVALPAFHARKVAALSLIPGGLQLVTGQVGQSPIVLVEPFQPFLEKLLQILGLALLQTQAPTQKMSIRENHHLRDALALAGARSRDDVEGLLGTFENVVFEGPGHEAARQLAASPAQARIISAHLRVAGFLERVEPFFLGLLLGRDVDPLSGRAGRSTPLEDAKVDLKAIMFHEAASIVRVLQAGGNPLRYCSECAAALSLRLVDGKDRHYCQACDRVHFLDPKVACCAVVQGPEGILLVRRDIEPARGLWSYPGGYMDRGETAPSAAAREVFEETGLVVSCRRLLGVYSYPTSIVLVIVYEAEILSGRASPGPECSEARWFSPGEIPWKELAFPSVQQALLDLGLSERQENRPGD